MGVAIWAALRQLVFLAFAFAHVYVIVVAFVNC